MKITNAILPVVLLGTSVSAKGLQARSLSLVIRQDDCGLIGSVACGSGCIPVGYECCAAFGAGCEPGTYCDGAGCCPDGEVCTGPGGIDTSTIDITNTLTYTDVNTIPVTTPVTTPAGPTTTPYAPPAATTTGPVASYTPGSPNAAAGMVEGRSQVLVFGCSIAAGVLTFMAALL